MIQDSTKDLEHPTIQYFTQVPEREETRLRCKNLPLLTLELNVALCSFNFDLVLMDSHVCLENTANQHTGFYFLVPGQRVTR